MTPTSRFLVAALGSALLVVGLVTPAQAEPARVPVPYVTASSPHTLTLQWPEVRGARRYTVYVASSPSKASRTTKRSHWSYGRRTTLTVKDLSSNRRYCFTVKAVRGGDSGRRSAPVCSFTLRSGKRPSADGAKVSVATFNVCAAAVNCKRWTAKREDAIVQRIVDANADVVALQEVTRKADKLGRRLAEHGYVRYAAPVNKVDEALYYRSSAAELAVAVDPARRCEVEPYRGPDNTLTWRFPRHFDEATQQWYAYQTSSWLTEQPVCRDHQLPLEQEGRIGSPTGATAVWAALRLKSNGKTYAFVSAHLSHGPTTADGRLRGREAKQLVASTRRAVNGLPVIFMGDFNSYRGGPDDDAPRRAMSNRGWVDTFDASSTYTRPYVSSFNGWQRKVETLAHWGGHIDRIFVPRQMGSTAWRVVAKTQKRRYVGTQASDHNLVRATILLP